MSKYYYVGQKIQLWQEYIGRGTRTVRILKSVMVTVTEVKTGVVGEFSREPSTDTSVRAVTEQGEVYERFWDVVPEAQMNDFYGQWTMRDDGMEEPDYPCFTFYSPKEAWVSYNYFLIYGKEKYKTIDRIVGPDGNEILPEGDLEKCDKHGTYQPKGVRCFPCLLEK